MKATQSTFRDLQAAYSAYVNNLNEAKQTYDEKIDSLDSDTYTQSAIDSKKAIARADAVVAVTKAMQSFTGALTSRVEELEKILADHFSETPSELLLSRLAVYRDFGIAPGKVEINKLMELARGNSFGIRAINAVLESTGSPYRISSHDTELEADLRLLKRLAEEPDAPTLDLVSFIAETTGKTYDQVFISSLSFRANAEKLSELAERWDNSIPPTITAIREYKDTTDPDSGKRLTAEQQIEADRKKAVDSVEVTETDQAEAFGRQLGRMKVEQAAEARRVMDYYAK